MPSCTMHDNILWLLTIPAGIWLILKISWTLGPAAVQLEWDAAETNDPKEHLWLLWKAGIYKIGGYSAIAILLVIAICIHNV